MAVVDVKVKFQAECSGSIAEFPWKRNLIALECVGTNDRTGESSEEQFCLCDAYTHALAKAIDKRIFPVNFPNLPNYDHSSMIMTYSFKKLEQIYYLLMHVGNGQTITLCCASNRMCCDMDLISSGTQRSC